MAIEQRIGLALVGMALAASVAAGQVKAAEINPNGWPVPDVANAKAFGCKMKDVISGIPGKETELCIYQAADGTYFNSLRIKDRIYGYYVDTNGAPPMEYVLFDDTGDRNFDYKNAAKGRSATPKWIIEYAAGTH